MRLFRSLALLIPAALAATPIAGASGVAAQEPVRLVASAARAGDPARDAAIERLTQFLARYPNSPLRPNALNQLGELLVQRADEEFAVSQRAAGGDTAAGRGDAPVRPNYDAAIARYEELVRRYPNFERIDAAAYTLGTLYFAEGRYADAARLFEVVTAQESSRFRSEAFFRLGDAYFEQAAGERGTVRRSLFARAAQAYERATQIAPKEGDIYFLALYKLGWSYYNQATQTNQAEYRKAVDVFGQLVEAYDKLTPQQQARLGLRGEAIEYMAIAFTQVGGADAASQYFEGRGGTEFKLPVLRRLAASLRDQGDFSRAVEAYRAVIAEAPTDSVALAAQREVIDIYQNRMLEPERAQEARLELVEKFGPGSAWAQANSALAAEAQRAREEALRQSAQFRLAQAQQRGDRSRYGEAAQLYARYLSEFASSDSARAVHFLYAEALFGQGEYARAGAEYSRTAYGYQGENAVAVRAGQNAIVAYDSALIRNRADVAAQDSMFAAVDRFVAAFGNTDVAKNALIQKGRRASESKRWDVMAQTFRTYAERFPNDAYTPTAQRLVGDALYQQGQYAEAQQQWDLAANVARQSGRRALVDTIARVRTAAAASFADTLIRQGEYRRAAEEVYVPFAERNPTSSEAPDALRNAIEAYMLADSAARARGDDSTSRQARERAVELSARLTAQYPSYRYSLQYQNLRAQLLADLGRREEAVEVLRTAVRANPRWSGRADAMVRIAVMLDSLGRPTDAAMAYEQFAAAYPQDRRAGDAQYNAAITYAQAGDNVAAARAYASFISRFPRDTRVAAARQARVGLLTAAGDTAAASAEIARLCARPTEEMRPTCAARAGEAAFRRGVAMWPQYKAQRLVISRENQLTRAGVERASATKQRMLRDMTEHFTRAIQSGSPQWLAASTYHVGLGQWEYGNFLRDVQLPAGLTDEERAAAQQGAAQQAEQFYEAARKTWQSLIEKAAADQQSFGGEAAPWVERARAALGGDVPATPPTAMRTPGAVTTGVN